MRNAKELLAESYELILHARRLVKQGRGDKAAGELVEALDRLHTAVLIMVEERDV